LKRVRTCAAVSFLVLACSGAAFGAVSAGQISVSPAIGGYTYDGGVHLKTAPLYSLKGGYSLTDNVGLEAGVAYSVTSSKLATDKNVAIFKYGVEGLYHFMPDQKLVPFVAAGLGGYNLSGPSALVSRKEMGFVDYGVGVKYFLYDRLALRADVRHIVANASAVEYTLGVTIPFGGATGPAKPELTFAAVKAALAKKRHEQAEAPQTPNREPIIVDIPVQKEIAPPRPVPPSTVAPEENRTRELSSSEQLAQLKELFAKEELERITTFRTEWEKGKEARLSAEKAARAREALDQTTIRDRQSMKGRENASEEIAGQRAKPSITSPKKKSLLKKRHKAIAKKRLRRPAAPW